MTAFARDRRMALALGITVPLLETGRVLLWEHEWPKLLQWPIALDACVVGAFLIWGAVRAARERGTALLGVGWGLFVGVGYRSFFEQLADPTRHAGHEVLVIAVKGALVAAGVLGAIWTVRAEPAPPSRR
jgi:hypothetical protein